MVSRSPADKAARRPGRDGAATDGLLNRFTRSPLLAPALVFVAALALRLVYIMQTSDTPFFETLGLDARYYDQWARRLAAGEGYGEPFFMSPLYPYFLAGLYRLFGRDLFVVRVVQALLGALSASLVYVLAKDLFDKRVGILAGLVTACYGALIFYDGSIVMTPLLVFLTLLCLFLLVRADRAERNAFLVAAGAALGLAAVGRAAILVFAPLALLWILREGWGGVRVRQAALFVVGLLLVVAPVTVRNYAVSGDFILITSNGGLNFYIGNGEVATGGYAKPQGLNIVRDPGGESIAEADLGRELTPSEVSSYWYSRAWSDIGSDPAAWLKLLARKLSFAVSSYEFPQLENYEFQRRYSSLLKLPLPGFGVVAPLGLLGLALAFRRKRPGVLGLFLASYLASLVAFFVLARYRLPVVPVLAIGASYSVVAGYDRLRAGAVKSVLRALPVLAVLAFLVNANLYSVDRQSPYAQIHYRLGIIYADRGEDEQAMSEFERAIRIDPDYPRSYLNLGALLAENGRHEEAIDAFEEVLSIDPSYADARTNLAMAHMARGHHEKAQEELERVLEAEPRNARALTQLGVALYGSGREEAALDALSRAEAADEEGTERAEIEFYRGMIEGRAGGQLTVAAERAIARADSLIQEGRAGEAVAVLEEAVAMAPDSGVPLQRLALLERNMGLTEEAISHLREALRIEPTVPHGHFMLGLLLNEADRHDQAILEYEAELRINPSYAPAHRNLAASYLYHRAERNRAVHHYREYLRLGGEPVPPLGRALGVAVTPNG
ncbi:MAG: tetratricopeptide repeat protein [Candidatus Eisenbacteria bacterium]|nr:tetratricopeptide repeat protein [Candidatus Eisenbacteria bacterium]